MVEPLRASGRGTLKTDVTEESVRRSRKVPRWEKVRAGNCATSTIAPSTMTPHTKSRALRGRRVMGFNSPTRLSNSGRSRMIPRPSECSSRPPVPHDLVDVAAGDGTPDDVAARSVGAAGAPDRTVRCHGAANDAVAVSAAHGAPRDAIAVPRLGGAPDHIRAPCVRVRVEHAAADAVIAPVDVGVP